VKKASEDYEALSFNTAISQMMIFINDVYKAKTIYKPYLEGFVQIFSCVCPFVGEEMWQKLGHQELLTYTKWPSYDPSKLVKATFKIAVAVNGKMRDVMEFDVGADEATLKAAALANPKIQAFIGDKPIKKVIVVPGKIVNLVI
jgi:leucyl-tRNA synthetase